MSNADDLLALADRCEREEASRELDSAIENWLAGGSDVDLAYILQNVGLATNPPPYTTSLDAALTLVPEGMLVENWSEMRDAGPLTGMWLAQLCPRGPRRRLAEISAAALRAVCDADPCTHAKTAALALCAAALRARAAVSHQNQSAMRSEAEPVQNPSKGQET